MAMAMVTVMATAEIRNDNKRSFTEAPFCDSCRDLETLL